MLTYKEQQKLFNKYVKHGKTPIRDSLDRNFALNDKFSFLENTISYTCIAFLDISGFSLTIQDFDTDDIKDYLEDYYQRIIPIISKYSGKIDKIMGDGIVVIFSEDFGDDNDINPIFNAFCCCADAIEEFMDSDKPIKASISSGDVVFCKTGVEQFYEELSCLGHPITVAYRLEAIAEKNQILILDDSDIANQISDVFNGDDVEWDTYLIKCNLQGLPEDQKVQILQF